MKKLLSSLLAAAVIAGLLPMTILTASASCLASNVYANDFETMITAPSGNYLNVGGWQVYENSGLADGRGGGSSLCVSGAPNKATVTASKGCYYCLPPENRMKTGIYNVNFDFNVGTSVSAMGVYFHEDASTSGKGAITNLDGKSPFQSDVGNWTKGQWYNADITIDLDARTWTVRVLNADGTVYKGWGTDYVYNGETLSLIEFASKSSDEVPAGSNTDTSAPYGLRIDNLYVRHYDGSLIYSNDFDTREFGPAYIEAQQEVGGTAQTATAGFVAGGYNGSAYGYAFAHADEKTATSASNSTEFYLPQVHKHDKGIYKVIFRARPGTYTSSFNIRFGGGKHHTASAYGDINTGDITGLTAGKWYIVELEVKVDELKYSLTVTDPDTSTAVISRPNVSVSRPASTDCIFRWISLKETTSRTGSAMPSGGGPLIDNLEIHYYNYGRIEGEDFDYGYVTNALKSGETRLGSGKWGLSGTAGFVAGGINGSTYALAPTFAPGIATNYTGSTEYWLPANEISTMGQYRISFWFRCGTGVNNMYFYASGISAFDIANSKNIGTLYDDSVMPKGQWYHADAVIDLDLHRYNIRFHNLNGDLIKQEEGAYSGSIYDKITYIGWHCAKNPSTLTADNCSLIDDVYITHNSAAVDETRIRGDHGITFDETNSEIAGAVSVFNDLWMSGSANQKKIQTFLGVYDADGNLVGFYAGEQETCPANDYKTAYVSTSNSNFENGGSGLTFRLFTWDYSSDEPLGKAVARVKP